MKNISLPFQNLNHDIQKQIEHQAREIILKRGDSLSTSCELKKYVYIVQKGKIKSYQINLDNGKEQIIYIYKKNHIIDTVTKI